MLNVPHTEYLRVYRRALLLLENLDASARLDLHELAHRIVERYFTQPDDLTRLTTLYLRRAQRRHLATIQYREGRHGGPDLSFNAREAAHDLLGLYLESRVQLTYEERYLYRHLLEGATFEETAHDLDVPPAQLMGIADSLYRKLRNPHAPATQEHPWSQRLRLFRGGGG